MKRNLVIILYAAVSTAVLMAVAAVIWLNVDANHDALPGQEHSFIPTETFTGKVSGKTVVFEHADYTRYRLTVDGVSTEGPLNTERGFGEDADATLFVLDWQKPSSEQTCFVRLTRDPSHLKPLDGDRTVIPGELFKLNK